MPAQPSNEWKIQKLKADGTADGDAATLASLGIESVDFEENNMAADTATLTVGGRDIDAATLWDYGQLLAVLDPAGVRRFVGRVEPWTRDGRPDAQNHFGRLVNPWWYFEHKIYEQTYRIAQFSNYPGVGTPQVVTGYATYTTPRVVLNVLFDGTFEGQGFYSATNGQQITDAVNWAISQGAPIKLGDTDPDTKPFSAFEKGIFVSDVIKLLFRKEPDFIVDWDYTTLPFPTVHFRKAKNMVPVTVDLRDATRRTMVSIKERPDWQRSYVKINYDQVNSPNGAPYLTTYADWYSAAGQGNATNGVATGVALPADAESRFRGVDLFCDLTGYATSSTSQTASFASKRFDIASLDKWKEWKPSLAAGTIAAVTLLTAGSAPAADANRPAPSIATQDELDDAGAAVAYDPDNVFEVVDGEWADWIPNVKGQRVRATAWAQIINKNGTVKYEQLTKDMTVVSQDTAGISKDFTQGNTSTTQYAEPIPVGLAKAMWQSWQNLAIEGNFTDEEAVVGQSGILTRSNCLNFLTAGDDVDWTNVRAMIQSRSWSIARGVTKIQFGAPLKITGHDLIDVVRATRYRVTTIDLGYLFGGALGGGSSQVRFGRKTHARHTQHGATHKEVDVVSKAVTPVAGTDPVVTTDGSTGITAWVPPGGPVSQPPIGAASPTPTITLDPSKAKGSDGNWHPVSLREQKICEVVNGVKKQRTVLVPTSESFRAPDDPA